MKNGMEEVTNHLALMAGELRTGMIDIKTAGEITNVAGKMIKAQAILLEAEKLKQKVPAVNLPFLESKKIEPPDKLMSKNLRQR